MFINKIVKNSSLSITAQFISLVVIGTLNLLVPKLVSIEQYALWQTYVLYMSYVGIFHFGLLDGIVLRYSKYDYEYLDKPRLNSQFRILFLLDSIIAIVVIALSILLLDNQYTLIGICVALGVVISNVFTYSNYLCQITNRISIYAKVVIAQKIVYISLVMVCVVFFNGYFLFICVSEIISNLVAVLYCAKYNHGLYFSRCSIPWNDALQEYKTNVSAGIILLIANWSSMLLIGSAKIVVQWKWTEIVFGKVAFAFSCTSMFLSFFTAISIVLFPILKRIDEKELPKLYLSIRNIAAPLLSLILLLYFPACWVLQKWLPNYSESLKYLGLLMPLFTYTAKVYLLTNNYLKAYRREKTLLSINTISIAIAFSMYIASAYIFDNLKLLLICAVIVMVFRSIASEIIVAKIVNISLGPKLAGEIVLSICFILCTQYLSLVSGFSAYGCFIIIYLIYNLKSIKAATRDIRLM